MSGLGLTFLRRGNLAHPIAGSDYILSESRGDAEVFRILMSKGVSSDGVGITKDDAARVTTISTWFKGNINITSFDELIYFVNVKNLEFQAFMNCSNLKSLDLTNIESLYGSVFSGCTNLCIEVVTENLKTMTGGSNFTGTAITSFVAPNVTAIIHNDFANCTSLTKVDLEAITNIAYRAFYNCKTLSSFVCRAATPPTLDTTAFASVSASMIIYVPDESVEAYKAATEWSQYRNRIMPILAYDGLFIFNNDATYFSTVQLVTKYRGEVVKPQYSVNGNATVDADGLLTFNDGGVVIVTATYNGMTATKNIEYIVTPIEQGVSLRNDGTVQSAADFSVVGFIPTGGATSIKWGATGGSIGTLCEYTENGTCQDYWTGNSNPRTVTIKATSTKVKATFSTANLDDAYIYDNTNGKYLWKGKNVV